MLETTINDGTQQFRFQEEIAEPSCVDPDVRPLCLFLLFSCSRAVFRTGRGLWLDGLFIFLVVDQVLCVAGVCASSMGWNKGARRRGSSRQQRVRGVRDGLCAECVTYIRLVGHCGSLGGRMGRGVG
jgi:hypothetical protein